MQRSVLLIISARVVPWNATMGNIVIPVTYACWILVLEGSRKGILPDLGPEEGIVPEMGIYNEVLKSLKGV